MNCRKHLLLVLLSLCLCSEHLYAQSGSIETFCVIRELDEVELPAKRNGLIEKLSVRRGHQISKGQQIGQLENVDIQLRLNVARSELVQAEVRAKNSGAVDSAKADVERAQQESKLLMELGDNAVFLEKFRMKNNLQRSVADLSTAENQLQQNQLLVQIKRGEARILENDIEQTRIQSPVNGVIKEMLKNQGEWVQRGEPILVATRMDRLVAEGFLDSATISPHAVIGTRVSVTFEFNDQPTLKLEGLVVKQAPPKLELDGKYPVWVEFNNQIVKNELNEDDWLIRPGMKAQMEIEIPRELNQVTTAPRNIDDPVEETATE